MKILYLGGHWINEYEDLKLFREIGVDVCSPFGVYRDPERPKPMDHPSWGPSWWTEVEGGYRPPLPDNGHADVVALARRHPQNALPRQVFEPFDMVIILGVVDWLTGNWKAMRGKKVVWRCNGQSADFVEKMLQPLRDEGLLIVRCSPTELGIGGRANLGADAVIRCYNDPEDWHGWTGEDCHVLCVCSKMAGRPVECNQHAFQLATNGLPRVLYGPGNEGLAYNRGAVSFEELQRLYRRARVFFAVNTQPSPYTGTFREAWMTGTPVVALGPKYGNRPGMDTYELHTLIENGVTGFWSDDLNELRGAAVRLLEDPDLAAKVGAAGRARAIEVFGREKIQQQWQKFFEHFAP